MKKNPLFRLERVQATINLMNLSHVFRNGETWTAVTGSGSEYDISDEEFTRIQEFFDPKSDGDKEANLDHFFDTMKKFKEAGLKFE